MRFRTLTILSGLCFTLFLAHQSTAQSAWTQEKGTFYSQLSYSTIANYSSIFSDDTYTTSREITDNTIQLFGEYGLADNVSLIVNVPLKSISTGDSTDNPTFPLRITETTSTALGNIALGLKHKIYDGKVALSGQVMVEANTGSFDQPSGIRTGYDAWTVTPTINLGKGYDGYYFQAFTGVDIRTNNYSSNFRIGGEAGITSIKKLTLIAYVDVVASFKNGDIVLPSSSLETALYINDQEYTAIGLKGLYSFSDTFGITAGLGGAISASNVPSQAALSVGVFYRNK